MKGPYENVLLGAFVFRLGYKMGESGKLKNTPFAANLFQQTPLDPIFSDFICESKPEAFSWNSREAGKEGFQSGRSTSTN